MLDQDQVQPVEKPDGLDEKSRSLRSNASPSSALPAVALDGSETGDSSPVIQLSKARQRVLMVTMASSGLLNIFTVQSTVIMLPSIGAALSIPTSRQQMITSTYNIAMGCLILLWSRLADIHGRRRVFLAGSALFTLATLAIPFSPVEACFYLLRALQGLGGAAIAPSALGILAATFPVGKQRTLAFVAFSAASSVGSVLGNVAGGVIGGFLSWRWVFWISAMLAGMVTVAAFFVAPKGSLTSGIGEPKAVLTVDWIGGALVTVALVFLLVALSQGNVVGWRVSWVIALLVLAIFFGSIFILWQRYLERKQGGCPLMKVSMFTNLRFSACFVTIGLFYASFNSFLIFATFFYQDYLGLGVLQTTLRFLPAGVIGALAGFAVAPAIAAIPNLYLLMFGITCGMLSPLLFAVPILPSTAYWAYGFPAMCLCVSADLVWPVVGLLVAESLPEADQSLGGGLLQTSNQVGRALGLAIATAVQTAVEGGGSAALAPGDDGLLRGVRAGQWTNVAMTVVTGVVAVVAFRGIPRPVTGVK